MLREDNYGFGFDGWQTHMRVLIAAFGGGSHVRKALSKEFRDALTSMQRNAMPANTFEFPDWVSATPSQFDLSRRVLDSSMRAVPDKPILATAPFGEVAVLELREDRVDLHGGEYHILCALISNHPSVYDSRSRSYVSKWSPFVTDVGMLLAHATEYPLSGDNKSVSTRSEASASKALRSLVERHFKVSFTNTEQVA